MNVAEMRSIPPSGFRVADMVVQQADFWPAILLARLCDDTRSILLPCRRDRYRVADGLGQVREELPAIETVFIEGGWLIQFDKFSIQQHRTYSNAWLTCRLGQKASFG
ncbi:MULTISPECIES: hypothetical protein [Aminobacter]|jgi:hypothetical protein|uniref:Uncharacterized protein n=1 Tax=Aminobacter aminovorans TaxID=83263 RepID=A0ABR6H3L5_AMIAI|nr:hypothetical protein [Aminobacter aminovorans]MBB3705107.1 hypothetical protein [Aminobacter aminovorans]